MTATKRAIAPKKMEEKESEERDRMTVYISKSIAKKFKILAIEEEKDYSQLAELAFIQFLQNYQKYKQRN